jgi:hypothetical protein
MEMMIFESRWKQNSFYTINSNFRKSFHIDASLSEPLSVKSEVFFGVFTEAALK